MEMASPRAVILPPVGRAAWSRQLQDKQQAMAVGLGASRAADEEARAEVEVLNSRLEKTSQLTKKIQASLNRLEASGKSLGDAIKPISGSTQRLQVIGNNIDNILAAIERVRQPSTTKSSEEEIIRRGPDGRLNGFLGSVQRVNRAINELQQTNLRSNQQAIADLARLLKTGNTKLEEYFEKLLVEASVKVEILQYVMKNDPFPQLKPDLLNQLAVISNYITNEAWNKSAGDSPVMNIYTNVRGTYLQQSLKNMSMASLNSAKNKKQGEVYNLDTNGITYYARAMETMFLAEHDNICAIFPRAEWGKALNLTCQGAISEISRTLRELNTIIKTNLPTDCFLGYEILEAISNLASNIESRTGELKPSFVAALKPIRETGKSSLGDLLEDTRRRVSSLTTLPIDGASVQITPEVMIRLQTMVKFLRPISSIMISLGDGGWKTNAQSNNVSLDQIPSLNSFDITADGNEIFAHYCSDTIDLLMGSLDQKAKMLLKNKQTLGVFIANNAVIVDRMISNSELRPLLEARMNDIEKWRKTGIQNYTSSWRDPSAHLMDVQYTNRGAQRPTSGSANAVDSAAILKGMSSKDKDAIKEKFRLFNTSFDELVAKHKSLNMEREVKDICARQVQGMIEPLYGRFWDRYHEVDKGKGKHVKYDKASISKVFASLG